MEYVMSVDEEQGGDASDAGKDDSDIGNNESNNAYAPRVLCIQYVLLLFTLRPCSTSATFSSHLL